jgi:AraC-like DNA-binding protein
MLYQEYQPDAALQPFIECVWFLSAEISSHEPLAERVFPDGCIEWIFHLGSPFHYLSTANRWEKQQPSFVVGELTRFLVLQPSTQISTMGVRFRPGGAYRFFPCPLHLLTNQIVSSTDVWQAAGNRIEDEVCSAATNDLRKLAVEKFLLRQMERVRARPRLDAAVSEIIRNQGQARVRDLAAQLSWSIRQLEREFQAAVGITPKSLARVIRFQNLLRLVGENALREWAGMAVAVGYADQPHMTREFREFSGHTPGEAKIGLLSSNFVSPKRLTALLGPMNSTLV